MTGGREGKIEIAYMENVVNFIQNEDGEPSVYTVGEDRSHHYHLQFKSGPNQPDTDSPHMTLPFIHMDDNGAYSSGITDEQLLKVLIDRSEYFQTKLPCPENEIALSCLKAALRAKQYRTELRRAKGVEGTHVKH
jgi:hypothetical protein